MSSIIYEGQVVQTDDPDQMGRVKVWIPAIDGEVYTIENLPWAEYASPLAGFTTEYPAGSNEDVANLSHSSYGFWAIPKIGATVFIFFVNGDSARRAYFASATRLHRNRSLPTGRNKDGFGKIGPWGDAGDGKGNLNPIEPAYTNLRSQFQNRLSESEAQTRGVYERQVGQAKFDKDGNEGYSETPIKDSDYLDSQTYCFVTPGRHALIFQDDPRFARLRVKTAEGHQIILDDANERIYISTSKGLTWSEMDADGRVNFFGATSYNVRSGGDINFRADGDINMEAGGSINAKAVGGMIRLQSQSEMHFSSSDAMFLSACGDLNASSEKGVKLSASQSVDILAGQDVAITAGRAIAATSSSHMKLQGSRIDLNSGPGRAATEAACAVGAASPTVVPGQEPWRRAPSPQKRGKNWKP